MAVSKIQLLYPSNGNADDADAIPIMKRTRLFLIAAGSTITIIAAQVYYLDFEVGLSIPFVVLNGSYAVMKLLFKVVTSLRANRKQKEYNTSAFDVCRKKLSIAESMFAFSLIFYKLIAVYQWADQMLSLMAMIYGGFAGIAIIFIGIRHAKQSQ